MNVVDGSAIWRQSFELDTTSRLSFHAGRKLRACVHACVSVSVCVCVCVCVSPLPQQFARRVGSLADQYHALDRPT